MKLLKEAQNKFLEQFGAVATQFEASDPNVDEDEDWMELDDSEDISLFQGPLDLFAAGGQTVIVKSMQGYKSALKWLYEDARIAFSHMKLITCS